MSLASRMFPFALPLLLATTAAQAGSSTPLPAPWSQRHGGFILPAQNGAQLGLVGFVNPATHRVTYGFRDLPQRNNCAPSSLGRGVVFDIEGTRLSFDKECVGGTMTYIPRNVPAKRAFAALLQNRSVLHIRTPSFFPFTFDLSGLPVVQQQLDVAAAKRRRDG